MRPNQKFIIGTKEWCCLPALDVMAIKARVDSGARISSIHASGVETFVRNTVEWVRFEINPLQRTRRVSITCEAPVADRRSIKSSNGASEERLIITTPLTLNGQTWDIELSLADRSSMSYRMLLGREAMKGRTMIDCEARFQAGSVTTEQLDLLYGKSERQSEPET